MTMYKLRFNLIAVFGCFFLFQLSGLTSIHASLYGKPRNDLAEFYQFLETMQETTASDSIAALESYLEAHGDLLRIYPYLLDHMLLYGRIDEAISYFSELKNQPPYRENSLWMLAKIAAIQGNIQDAYHYYKQSLQNGQSSLLFLDDFAEFLHHHEEVFDGPKEIQRFELGPTQEKIAMSFWLRRNLEFRRTYQLLSQLPSEDQNNMFVLHLFGHLYATIPDYAMADSCMQQALEIARSAGDLQFQAFCLAGLGVLAKKQNNLEQAGRYYNEALAIVNRINDLGLIQFVESNLASFYLTQNKHEEALKKLNNSIHIAESLGQFHTAAREYFLKGQVLFDLENYNGILDSFKQCERLIERANDEKLRFSLWMEQGRFYQHLKLNTLAKYEFQRSCKWARSRSLGKELNRAQAKLAELLFHEKKYAETRELCKKLLATPEEKARKIDRAYWTWLIAESYYLENEFENAHPEYLTASKIAERAMPSLYREGLKASIRLRIGDIQLKKDNPSRAIEIYRESFISQVAQKDAELRAELYYCLGNAFRHIGKIDTALSYYVNAVRVIEQNRQTLKVDQFRIGYFSKGVKVYDAVIQTYFERYEHHKRAADLEKLFYYLEMSRSRALKDFRFKNNSNMAAVKNSPKYDAYQSACRRFERLQRELRYNDSAYDSLKVSLEAARYNLIAARLQLIKERSPSSEAALSLQQLRARLSRLNSSLLFFHFTTDVGFVLALNEDNVNVIHLPINSDTLSSLVDSLTAPFHHVIETDIEKVPFRADIAYKLYTQLIQPVEQQTTLRKRLMIVPDGVVRKLPLEMLLVHPPETQEYFPTDSASYSDDFLLYRYAMIYSPSTWLTPVFSGSPEVEPNILVFANPTPNEATLNATGMSMTRGWHFRSNRQFKTLWYADSEGEYIKDIYPRTKVFRRDKATLQSFLDKAGQFDILHFATHAFVDSVFDAFSGLMFASSGDSLEDDFLMGFEISDLELNCDLVTLSGCETGVGKLVAGEGVMGMPYLFLNAGARRVLMTHWKVSDKFSLELMPAFYDYFLNQESSEPAALQKAKIAVLQKSAKANNIYYQHPLFWAAFTLYGEPDMPPQKGFPFVSLLLTVLAIAGILLTIYYLYRH